MTRRARWTVAMTALGVTTAAVVWVVTGSAGWALVGLLASGVVANALVAPRATRSRGA